MNDFSLYEHISETNEPLQLLSVCFCRIYPKEHFKEKYAVEEVHYTTDVSWNDIVNTTDFDMQSVFFTPGAANRLYRVIYDLGSQPWASAMT